jgi:hypothetical protein
MEHRERRIAERVPLGIYVQQIIDGESHRCFATNISMSGIYVEHVTTRFVRTSRTVQLELPLVEDAEPLWLAGEVIYDALDRLFVGSAIRFHAMAERDRGRLDAWLRRGVLEQRERPVWFAPSPPSRRLH